MLDNRTALLLALTLAAGVAAYAVQNWIGEDEIISRTAPPVLIRPRQ